MPAWDVDYDGSVEPDAATPAWVLAGSDFATSDGDILTIDDGDASSNCSYEHAAEGTDWYDSVNNATGWTFEIRMKYFTPVSDPSWGCGIYLRDGAYEPNLRIGDAAVLWNGSTYNMDTTDDFHVYRMTVVGTTHILYIDGISRITAQAGGSVNVGVNWGKYGSTPTGMKHEWDYVKYYLSGAVAPPIADTKSLVARGIVLKTGSKNL